MIERWLGRRVKGKGQAIVLHFDLGTYGRQVSNCLRVLLLQICSLSEELLAVEGIRLGV